MKISHLSRPRYRLIYRILALVIVVGALSSTPAPANVEPPPCQFGCIHWVKGIGCLDCQICCVDSRETSRARMISTSEIVGPESPVRINGARNAKDNL